jgi:ABC-type Fe3+-hydroxamate transport system substrate-binding protein
MAMIVGFAAACSSGSDTAVAKASTTAASSGGSSTSTLGGGSPTTSSKSPAISACSVVTDAVSTTVYGPDATVTTSPSNGNKVCEVNIKGLSYTLAVTVGADSDYGMQKSIAFKNPTAFPGLGKEAVIGKSSDETGAAPGLVYRTGSAMVYITGESDLTKLAALGTAIAARG